jgi:hypothetical protein
VSWAALEKRRGTKWVVSELGQEEDVSRGEQRLNEVGDREIGGTTINR